MPKYSSHILELARRGAELRWHELQAEVAALIKLFPHLSGLSKARRGGRGRAALTVPAVAPPPGATKARKRRTMSAEARAKIAAAQKRRWAKVRAAAKK
jgi:hypothetical protein